ncbi:MAG: hypothetical protein QM731_07470 [Chitinophagaceae bacterium]
MPVTLNLFLALEFVLTFGILNTFCCYTLLALLNRPETFWAVWAIKFVAFLPDQNLKWSAKVCIFNENQDKRATIAEKKAHSARITGNAKIHYLKLIDYHRFIIRCANRESADGNAVSGVGF